MQSFREYLTEAAKKQEIDFHKSPAATISQLKKIYTPNERAAAIKHIENYFRNFLLHKNYDPSNPAHKLMWQPGVANKLKAELIDKVKAEWYY
jgi:hypothetical protein